MGTREVIPAASYEDIFDIITREYDWDNISVKMVGLVFAIPGREVADEILSNDVLNWYNVRSEKYIHFIFPGYINNEIPIENKPINTVNTKWAFVPERLWDVVKKVQYQTGWKFRGETTLLLANAHYNKIKNTAFIDYDSMIECNLEGMLELKAISSVSDFFHRIFEFTENATGDDPTWGFSDLQGAKTVVEGLKNVILSLLPYEMGDELKKVALFAVRR